MHLHARLWRMSWATVATTMIGMGLLVPAVGDAVGPANHAILIAAALTAAHRMWRATSREATAWHPLRRGWTALSIGLLLAASSDAGYLWHYLRFGELGFPSIPDLIWLAAIIVILVGVFMVPHPIYTGMTRVKLRLDQATGVTALLALAWIGYFDKLLESDLVSTGIYGDLLASAFTSIDIAALVSVLILTTRRGPVSFDPAILALTWAVALNSLGNLATGILSELTGQTSTGFWWVNGFYVLSIAAFMAAADTVGLRGLVKPSPTGELRPRVVFAPYMLVAILVGAYIAHLIGSSGSPDDAIAPLALLVVAALVIARQSVAIGETRAYMERQRNEMVASVSHELRTPLTAVSGFSSMLAERWDDLDDSTRREFVNHIDTHSGRLGRIVHDLIELARNGLENVALQPELIDVGEIVDEAIESVSVAHDIPGRIVRVIPSGLTVFADRARITQVIANLVSNAVKYGRGVVEIGGRVSGDRVAISVADNGAGIPDKWQVAIFDRFERGAHRFDSAVPGSGLGLSISLALAEAHGGTITIAESSTLGGAEFALELPWMPVARPHRTSPTPVP